MLLLLLFVVISICLLVLFENLLRCGIVYVDVVGGRCGRWSGNNDFHLQTAFFHTSTQRLCLVALRGQLGALINSLRVEAHWNTVPVLASCGTLQLSDRQLKISDRDRCSKFQFCPWTPLKWEMSSPDVVFGRKFLVDGLKFMGGGSVASLLSHWVDLSALMNSFSRSVFSTLMMLVVWQNTAQRISKHPFSVVATKLLARGPVMTLAEVRFDSTLKHV